MIYEYVDINIIMITLSLTIGYYYINKDDNFIIKKDISTNKWT